MSERPKSGPEPIRRPRFFHGMFARAADWQQAHDYHVAMRWLHNRAMHTPGIVRGFLDEYRVRATQKGDHLEVSPGLALDGNGRELLLTEAQTLAVDLRGINAATTLYVRARVEDVLSDRRDDPGNPGLSDFAAITERIQVEASHEPPDGTEWLELARVRLTPNPPAILNPPQGTAPGLNQLDATLAPWAGVRQTFSLRDSAELVRAGQVNVPVSAEPEILLESVPGDVHRFYVANVRPGGTGALSWEIQGRADGGADKINYVLVFRNRGQTGTVGHYAVYRLRE